MLELEQRAPLGFRDQAKDKLRADPFVLACELVGGAVRAGAEPAHFAAWFEFFDAHVLVHAAEAEADRAADIGRDIAILRPPASQAGPRSERGIDRGGGRLEDEASPEMAHRSGSLNKQPKGCI